jgi:hypothetical protein
VEVKSSLRHDWPTPFADLGLAPQFRGSEAIPLKGPGSARRLSDMRQREEAQRNSAGCQVHGCNSSSDRYLITRDGVTLQVCQMCMQELVGMAGWTNTGVVGSVVHVRAAGLTTT